MTKRRDALAALGVEDEGEQDAYIEYDDLLIDTNLAVFGSNFEEALRAKFPTYEEVEEEGRESGGNSKPFLARHVAERLKNDNADGWKKMKSHGAAFHNTSGRPVLLLVRRITK